MQRHTFLSRSFLIGFAGFLAISSATVSARGSSLPCECTLGFFESKVDHLNAWTNMTTAVNGARGDLRNIEKASNDAEDALKDLRSSQQKLEQAIKGLDRVWDEAATVKRAASKSLFGAGRQADLKSFRSEVEKTWTNLQEKVKLVFSQEKAVDEADTKLDEAVQAARTVRATFDAHLNSIRAIGGANLNTKCVENLWRESRTTILDGVKAQEEKIKGFKDAAETLGNALSSRRRDAERKAADVSEWIRKLADDLGLEGISTFSALDARLAELSRSKVLVHFSNGDEKLEILEKFDNEPVAAPALNPEPRRPGMVLDGWRERSGRGDERFQFGFPTDHDLDLVAVWVYEVSVRGVDKVWRIPADGRHTLREVLESEEVRSAESAYREKLKENKTWAGWETDEDSPQSVNVRTIVIGPMTLRPSDKDIFFQVFWYGADHRQIVRDVLRKGETPTLLELPADTQRFKYQWWSETPDGEKYEPRPLDGDLSLYAVRKVAENLIALAFFDFDGTTPLGETAVKEKTDFDSDEVEKPKEPKRSGHRFAAWGKSRISTVGFAGPVEEPERGKGLRLFALYRDASWSEMIDDALEGIRSDCPFPVVVVADVFLLVLFVFLFATGLRRSPGRRAAANAEADGTDGASSDSSFAEASREGGGSDSAPSVPVQPPSEPGGSAGAKLSALALLLVPMAACASEEAGVDPFQVPPFDPACLLYPGALLLGIALAVADAWMLLRRMGRAVVRLLSGIASIFSRPRRAAGGMDPVGHGAAEPESSGPEECPTCGARLVDGECPDGHTIVRCSKCGRIMKDGVCSHCGVGGEVEFCPTCNSELVDGECPRGHTIVRCPDCGSILLEGVCPKGCNADPLNIGWPGGASRTLSTFALRVVECPKSEGQGFTLRVPDSFVVGRSSTDCKEPFVELLTITRKEKAQCSRQYVRFDRGGANGAFTVTLLNSSRNPAFVDGRKLVMQNDTAPISLGGRIKLNPGYELELVEAPSEG